MNIILYVPYNPTGKRLDHKYTHKVTKPITPNPWVFQVFGPKNRSSYVAHYSSEKYKEDMKKVQKKGRLRQDSTAANHVT